MLDTVFQQLGQGYWLSAIPGIMPILGSHPLSHKDADELIFKKQDEAKKNHKGRALNFISLALAWDQQLALACVRKRGILRASSFNLDHRIPLHIVTELLRHSAALNLDTPTRVYLQSCHALLKAAPHFQAARESLRTEILRHSESLLQGALAVVSLAR
jgi:hypothetical protein